MDEVASDRGSARSIGVGVIGFGWMGRVQRHVHARVRHHFPDLALVPELVAAADEVPGRAEQAAAQFGFTTAVRDWRDVLADSRVGAVSVTAPIWRRREIGIAVVEPGRHLWIEKPDGSSADVARAFCAAVQAARVQSAVGFDHRNAPAVALARGMLDAGGIGQVAHARFHFLSDDGASPEGAPTWRYEGARGGSGVLGDLASHAVDLVRHLLGTVENDDYVAAPLRPTFGARVVLEASRIAGGEQNTYGVGVHGTTGALSWDFRRMSELAVGRGGCPRTSRSSRPGRSCARSRRGARAARPRRTPCVPPSPSTPWRPRRTALPGSMSRGQCPRGSPETLTCIVGHVTFHVITSEHDDGGRQGAQLSSNAHADVRNCPTRPTPVRGHPTRRRA
jgi:predicted dehydrogenase